MTDSTQHRLSLLLAIAGALVVAAHGWNSLALTGRRDAPAFERPAPDVRDWPSHQYLPIG